MACPWGLAVDRNDQSSNFSRPARQKELYDAIDAILYFIDNAERLEAGQPSQAARDQAAFHRRCAGYVMCRVDSVRAGRADSRPGEAIGIDRLRDIACRGGPVTDHADFRAALIGVARLVATELTSIPDCITARWIVGILHASAEPVPVEMAQAYATHYKKRLRLAVHPDKHQEADRDWATETYKQLGQWLDALGV